jgi:hypothetical protein
MPLGVLASRHEIIYNACAFIPVVINMFRLPIFLTGENIPANRLKLL